MVEINPTWLSRESERSWITDSQVDAFLARVDDARPLNIVGGSAALGDRIARSRPDLRLRVICPSVEEEPAIDLAGTADIHHADPSRIPELLLPKSRTLILNPFLATKLLAEPDFWRDLGLKTFEWALAPLMVQPASFTLFSDDFSFLEPLFDDAGSHWCWSMKPAGIVWVATNCQTATFLSFTLTSGRAGMFEAQFGNAILRERVEHANQTVCFRLPCRLSPGANSFRIGFDGPAFKPEGADDRETLTFCVANLELASAPPTFTADPQDRAVRRLLHSRGFFEIRTAAPAGTPLSHLDGLRSCYDYREGFRFRDYRRFARESTVPDANPSFPAVWYCLRKTPTPASEWEEPLLPCAENPILLDWNPETLARTHAHPDLEATRHLLVERTAALERASQDILSRDAELVHIRDLLKERTAALERAAQDLLTRDAELSQLRRLLVDRTSALEAALGGAAERIEHDQVSEMES